MKLVYKLCSLLRFKDLNRRTAVDKVLRDKAFGLLKIRNMTNINMNLHQWSVNLLIKNPLVVVSKLKMFLIKNQQKSYTKQLSKNSIKENYIQILLAILGSRFSRFNKTQQLDLINLIKDLEFYYVLLIFIANIHGLFL